MKRKKLHIIPKTPVPEFLQREIRAKIPYIDERILEVSVSPGQLGIDLTMQDEIGDTDSSLLTKNVNHFSS